MTKEMKCAKPKRAERKKTERQLAKYGLAMHQLRSQQDVQAVVRPAASRFGSLSKGWARAHVSFSR